MEIKSERNYGIDTLRLLAMFMVVLLHVLGQGGVLSVSIPFTGQYYVNYALEIAAYCAVNCYVLISGYVGIYSRYKYSNLALLWIKVIFYTIIITAIFQCLFPEMVSLENWINAFFPIMFKQYWFFSAYFVLFLFMPLLNTALHKFSRKQIKIILLILIFFLSVLNTVIYFTDAFELNNGYSAWWMIVVYLVGGYIRKYQVFDNKKRKYLIIGYIFMIILTMGAKLLIEAGSSIILGRLISGDMLLKYTSPTILFSSVFLLGLFSNIKIKQKYTKFVKKFTPLVFSVYLIHAHPLIWSNLLKNRFARYATLSFGVGTIYILLTSLIIFLVCLLIDYMREMFFQKLKIKKRLDDLELKLKSRLL